MKDQKGRESLQIYNTGAEILPIFAYEIKQESTYLSSTIEHQKVNRKYWG